MNDDDLDIFDDMDEMDDDSQVVKKKRPNREKAKDHTIKKRQKKDNNPNMGGKTIDQILGLANKKIGNELEKFCVDYIPIEHSMVENITDVSPVLGDAVGKGNDIIKTYGEFSKDLFLSLYKSYPEIIAQDEVNGNYMVNHSMLDELTSLAKYEQLREYCQLDEFSSALAALGMHESAIEHLEELKEQLQEQGGDNVIDATNNAVDADQAMQQAMQNAQAYQDLKDALGDKMPDNLKQIEGKMAMDLKNAMELAEQQAQQMKKVIDENPDQMKKVNQAVQSGIKSAIDNVTQAQDTIEQWGFDPGDEIRVSIDSKLRAIQMIRKSKKLKKFSDLIGALKELARKEQKAKNKNGTSNIINVQTGNRLPYVLPSEKMLLNNPITKKDFHRRFLEGNLLEYELNSTEKKGRGPLIVCVDVSGSMQGDPEIWAKSFAVALIDIAQMQKRNYCYISFESRIEDVIVIEKGYLDPAVITGICEKSTTGGTNFQYPLEKSLEMLKDSRFKKGDIVFVTDGDCSLSSDFIKKFKKIKEEKEFSCRGVLINVGNHASKSSLEPFCDDILLLSNIVDFAKDGVIAQQIFHDI